MCQDFAEYLFDTQWAKKITPKKVQFKGAGYTII